MASHTKSRTMSVSKQIEKYCAEHKDAWIPSGEIQRMEFKNKDGTLATPRSLVRRLQELENQKILAVQHLSKKQTSEYRWIPHDWRTRYNTLVEREEKGLGMWKQLSTGVTLQAVEVV